MWSSLVIPTFLFLSFSSVGLAPDPGSTTHENDNYPPFWDQTDGDIAEFPVQNNKIIVDPWKYMDRLRIYKILITESNKYFASFGKNDTGNVFWTLTLLYGRLFKSGMYIWIIPKENCFSLSLMLEVALQLNYLSVTIWILMHSVNITNAVNITVYL